MGYMTTLRNHTISSQNDCVLSSDEVHDFNVLKIFSEADNIPRAILGKYEYNFTVRKTLEAKNLGK